MNDDLLKRLPQAGELTLPMWQECLVRYNEMLTEQERKIGWLEDKIAAIQYTNLRRDMNLKTRTQEIDNLCKEKWKQE